MRKLALALAGAAVLCVTPLSVHQGKLAVDSAEARIGRPLTPGSIAGVNRRVHRRAYRGAAYGAAAYGAYGAAYPYYGHAGYRRHCTCY